MSEITHWLNDRQQRGHRDDPVVQQLYQDLKTLARARMQSERDGHTLSPTALVHEAWLKLERSKPDLWRDRKQFYAAAVEAMRRILVDAARRRLARKRGAGEDKIALDSFEVPSQLPDDRLIAVHETLELLEAEDPMKAMIVKLKFFVGLKTVEIAEMLEVNEKTIRRHWNLAKVWLLRSLEEEER